MNQLSFSDLIIKFWDHILAYMWPLRFRHEGTVIIRKTYGEPKDVLNTQRWCWKWPLFQSFDVVDVRSHTFNSTAHSFFSDKTKFIPYNMVIDTQVEFRIINPLVIYKINNNFDTLQNPMYSFVSNEVHSIILAALEPGVVEDKIDSKQMQILINEELMTRINAPKEDAGYEKDVLIEKIVITSFDYNISLRWAQ